MFALESSCFAPSKPMLSSFLNSSFSCLRSVCLCLSICSLTCLQIACENFMKLCTCYLYLLPVICICTCYLYRSPPLTTLLCTSCFVDDLIFLHSDTCKVARHQWSSTSDPSPPAWSGALLTQVQSMQCTAGPCSDGPLFAKIANYDTWFPSVRMENSESGPCENSCTDIYRTLKAPLCLSNTAGSKWFGWWHSRPSQSFENMASSAKPKSADFSRVVCVWLWSPVKCSML